MTMKHVKFNDSIVMRELERQALKKGTFVPETKDIIKTASISKYASTGDILLDLVHLAQGLREKGLVKEAKSLEEKMFVYKKASSQYQEELDKAHPDGDVKMVDGGDLADVETLESQHEKMLSIVKKDPTGKQAELINNILKAAQDSLGLKKKAQETVNNEVAPSTTSSAQDFYSGQTANRQTNVKNINTELLRAFPDIVKTLNEKDVDSTKWIFTYDALSNPESKIRELYALKASIPFDEIKRYFQIDLYLYPNNAERDVSTIAAQIFEFVKNKNFKGLINFGNIIDPKITKKYFIGHRSTNILAENELQHNFKGGNSSLSEDPRFPLNQTSIWGVGLIKGMLNSLTQGIVDLIPGVEKGDVVSFYEPLNDEINIAAQEIQNLHRAEYERLFSEEKLKEATSKIQSEINNILSVWNNATLTFSKKIQLPEDQKSITELYTNLISIGNNIVSNYGKNSDNVNKITQYASVMYPGWNTNIAEKAQEAKNKIDNLSNFLIVNPLSSVDIPMPDASQYINLLISAGRIFHEEAIKYEKTNVKKTKDFVENRDKLFNLSQILKNGIGKPYVLTYNAIKGIFPDATTYEKLLEYVNSWIQATGQFTGREVTASTNNDLLKFSQALAGGKLPTPSSSGKATGAQPLGKTRGDAGLAKANMNDPKEASIAKMQAFLIFFANYLASVSDEMQVDDNDITTILSTGPVKNPTVNQMDGKWGEQTENALKIANKYLKQLKLSELDTRARYVNRVTSNDAKSVADSNTKILSQAIKVLKGESVSSTNKQQGKSNSIYDILPKRIDWKDFEFKGLDPSNFINKLLVSDMSSLGALVDWLLKNNIITIQTKQQIEDYRKTQKPQVDLGYVKAQLSRQRTPLQIASDPVSPGKQKPTQLQAKGLSGSQLLAIVQWFQQRAAYLYNSVDRAKNAAQADIYRQYYAAGEALEAQLQNLVSRFGGNYSAIIDIDQIRTFGGGQGGSSGLQDQYGRQPSSSGGFSGGNKRRGFGQEGEDINQPFAAEQTPPIDIRNNGAINLHSPWFRGAFTDIKKPLLDISSFENFSAKDLAGMFFRNSFTSEEAFNKAYERFNLQPGSILTPEQKTTVSRYYQQLIQMGPEKSFGNLIQRILGELVDATDQWTAYAKSEPAEQQAENNWLLRWKQVLTRKSQELMT